MKVESREGAELTLSGFPRALNITGLKSTGVRLNVLGHITVKHKSILG